MKLTVMFLLFEFSNAARSLGLNDNVYCGIPRPTVVAVEPKRHAYFPYYVTLHRCEGSWLTWRPINRICAATRYEEVKTQVYSPLTGETSTINLKNHTNCGFQCVTKPSECDFALEFWEPEKCICECKYPQGPPTPCKEGFRWSQVYCKCVCNKPPRVCPIRQEWSSELCDCTCDERTVKRCARKKKGLDHNSCTCVDVAALMRGSEDSANSQMYITLLVVQFCVIVFLVSVLVHCKRKKRCPQRHSTNIMASTRNSTDTLNSDSTEKKGNSTAGSVTIEMGVERQDSKTSDVDRETDL